MTEHSCAKANFQKIVSLYIENKGKPFNSDGRITVVPQTGCKANCGYMCMLDIVVKNGTINEVNPYESGICVREKDQQ